MDNDMLKEMVTESTQNVFKTMISVTVCPSEHNGKPMFISEAHLSASIGFAGGWNGSVMLQCGTDLAFQLTSKLLLTDVNSLKKEYVRDAIGELVNMIGGKFKALFADRFNNGIEAFKMSIPTVTMGKNFQIYNVMIDSVLEVFLETQLEKFIIKIALKKRAVHN